MPAKPVSGTRLLADHVVALTGVETPFGRALALGLVDAGARLILPTLATPPISRTAGEIGGIEGATELEIADASREALTAALDGASTVPVDALVHARIPARALEMGALAEITDAQWERVAKTSCSPRSRRWVRGSPQ